MKILLLLMCFHLQAAFEFDSSPDFVTFKRTYITSHRISDPDRSLTQMSPYNVQSLQREIVGFVAPYQLATKVVGNWLFVVGNVNGVVRALFQCGIEQSNKNAVKLTRNYIVCTNKPNPLDPNSPFKAFLHHHGIYRRPISSNNAIAQSAFIKSSVEKLKVMADQVLMPPGVMDLYDLVAKVIANEKIEDVVVKDKFKLKNSVGFDLFTKESDLKIYQVVVFTINKAYLGMDFSIFDKTHLLIVARRNLPSAYEDIKAILATKPAEEELKRLELGDMPLQVKSFIGEQCKTDVPTVKTGKIVMTSPRAQPTSLQILASRDSGPIPSKPEEICGFGDTSFIITYFHYGYMQYFHLFFDSKQLSYESAIVAEKSKFQEKFNGVMTLLKENVDLVVKSQAYTTMEVLVTDVGIKEVLQAGFGEPPTLEVYSEPEKQYYARQQVNAVAKYSFGAAHIRAKVLQNKDGFVIKLSKVEGADFSPVYGEITLPASNGYDYKEALKKNLEDYLKKAQEKIEVPAVAG
jgi:hypothetical protein